MSKQPDSGKQPRKAQPRSQASAKQADAREENGSFQPHNAKKEGLGPNTKR